MPDLEHRRIGWFRRNLGNIPLLLQFPRQIVDVTEKEGKSRKWLFVTTEIRYTNQEGDLLGINIETMACGY